MNLVLITSVLEPVNSPLSYTNTRSVYTPQERMEQTLRTIDSVRQFIPNSYIIVLECSRKSDLTEKIRGCVNFHVNYFNNEEVLQDINSIYKGAGECKTLATFLKEYENLKQYENLYKLSGRYYLNDNFDMSKFENDKNVFKFYGNSVSTRLYKIHKKYYDHFLCSLCLCHSQIASTGQSVEDIFPQFFDTNIQKVTSLGVSGNVAVDGNFIDE